MFKFTIAMFALIACVAAKPGVVAPLAYSAPLIGAPGVVTAASSQVVARQFNGIASAPLVAAAPAPIVAAPLAARYFASPYAAAPLAAAPIAAPLAAAPLAARYLASPYTAPIASPLIAPGLPFTSPLAPAPLAYSAGLRYAAGATPILF